jgi:hypothetical protein
MKCTLKTIKIPTPRKCHIGDVENGIEKKSKILSTCGNQEAGFRAKNREIKHINLLTVKVFSIRLLSMEIK